MGKIVTAVTLDEIKDAYRETYAGNDWEVAFENTLTENDRPLLIYDDEDEFYTDGLVYVAVDEADELITWEKANKYITDENLEQEFVDYAFCDVVRRELMQPNSLTLIDKETKRKAYVDYAGEDITAYLEWLWGQE